MDSYLDAPLWDLGFVKGPKKIPTQDVDLNRYDSPYYNQFRIDLGKALADSFVEFQRSTNHHGLGLSFTIRTPEYNRVIAESDDDIVGEWHVDGGDVEGRPNYIAIWSNVCPTELRKFRGRTIYTLKPGHVYVFDNKYWKHRMPIQDFTPDILAKRWFARMFLGGV